jgi:DNA invertase Pin-like site-specific DNA recombinase
MSGLGLEAQGRAIGTAVESRGWTMAVDQIDEGVSGSIPPSRRPALAEGLDMLDRGDADILIVSRLDRATRSVADLCDLLDRSTRRGWDFVALDLGIDTSTPMGRAMAQMSGVFSELERRLIGQRTADALAVLKANGERLGRPISLPDKIRHRIADERADGQSFARIADGLNIEQVTTAHGGARWYPATVRKVLQSIAIDEEASAASGSPL